MINESIVRLLNYCENNDWGGFDPYDALNSRVFASTPFSQNSICRLFLIQIMKRFPINIRSLLLVPKEQNPKGLALFTSALIKLSDLGFQNGSGLATSVVDRLVALRTPKRPYFCWGYNFDWQSRGFFLPKFEPNIICTTFAANALLDFYTKCAKTNYLDMAVSAGHFLISALNITQDKNGLCFSYTPRDQSQIHNANLLAAALLARLYNVTNDKKFLDFALQAAHFSVSKQRPDGSWPYGEGKKQGWIDNFHTGYNLVALKKFSKYSRDQSFRDNIEKGFTFYTRHFFTAKGVPKYYHNSIFPIDIHSIAQSIITLTDLQNNDNAALTLLNSVYSWALKNMQSKKGYFFYQQGRFFTNRISYMRWSQAWMLYALAILLENLRASRKSINVHFK